MKTKEKETAIELRKSGLSVKKISRQLGVSKSSVSIWVRNVELTDEQKLKLRPCALASGLAISERFRKIREENRTNGRKKAQEKNLLHAMGCMLYWAEGWHTNNRSSVSFCNSSTAMMKLFLKFLKECYSVTEKEISISINCYTDIHTADKIEKYWLSELSLPYSCLRKTTADKRPECTKKKKNGLLQWGTCRISVHDGIILQNIYGAIQEYGNFISDNWI